MKGLEPLYLLVPVMNYFNKHGTIRKPGGSTYNPPRRLAAEAGKCLSKRRLYMKRKRANAREKCNVKENDWHH